MESAAAARDRYGNAAAHSRRQPRSTKISGAASNAPTDEGSPTESTEAKMRHDCLFDLVTVAAGTERCTIAKTDTTDWEAEAATGFKQPKRTT